MLENVLPQNIANALNRYQNLIELNEIRLRVNKPVVVIVKNKKYYLGERGFTSLENAIVLDYESIQRIVFKMCDNSVYSVNDCIKNGYITLQGGIRVGLTGEVVSEQGQVTTIKNFQALNFRIPHFVEGCSTIALEYILNGKFNNTLILSPPGAGKTTFIRDIVYQLYKRNYCYNILIADERNEIMSMLNAESCFDLGGFCDVYTNCSKEFAFKHGIRSMNPDIIVCDEIDIDKDLETVVGATNCGVKVLCTLHCDNINQLKTKKNFDKIFNNKVFDRYIFLSNLEGPGTLTSIYDANLKCIYCR